MSISLFTWCEEIIKIVTSIVYWQLFGYGQVVTSIANQPSKIYQYVWQDLQTSRVTMHAVYCVWKDASTTDSMLPRRWCAAANVRRGFTPTALLRSTSQASGRASGAGWCPHTSVRCRMISATWCPWWRPSHHQSPLSVTTTGNSPGSWMRGKKPALNCWKKIVTSAHKLAPFSSSQAPLTGLAFPSLTARCCWEAA